jgi:gamma-glutamyltranspeptidase/glutathione hydrolase
MNLKRIEDNFVATADRKNAIGRKGMVSAAFPEAAEAGAEVLRQGGNAIDAACATSFVLGVVEPQGSGLGGQSMGIMHVNGRTVCIDGSTPVPALAYADAFDPDAEAAIGHKATTVPGTVAFWGYLHRHYGRVPWRELLQPAIRAARAGYRMTAYQHSIQNYGFEWFLREASQSGTRLFLADGPRPIPVGTLCQQPALADTLQHLADHGAEAFYTGEIAQTIDADMRHYGGFLRLADLAAIPWPTERAVISSQFRGMDVCTTPPPTAGVTLLQALALVERLSAEWHEFTDLERARLLVETYRRLFQLREASAYHPQLKPLDLDQALDPIWLGALAQAVLAQKDVLPTQPQVKRGGETTQISVVDSDGNAIGVSQSLYFMYGAFAACEPLGFMYNDYLTRFEKRDASHPFYLRPGAIPWTSVAPALLFDEGELWFVVGTPGAERIFSAMSGFFLELFDGSHSLATAMSRPRLHCDADGKAYVESADKRTDLSDYLAQCGYKVKRYPGHDFSFGGVHAVMRCRTRPEFHGSADPRRDGIAIGV